jgi:hypothetical protein
MGDSCGDVLESESVLGQHGDLEYDPPCAGEAGEVDLQAAWQARAGRVLCVAVPAFGGGDAVTLVPAARGLERGPRSFR